MRAIAIVLGLLALVALLFLMPSIVQISRQAVRHRSVRIPLSAAAVFTVLCVVASCSASIIAPTGG